MNYFQLSDGFIECVEAYREEIAMKATEVLRLATGDEAIVFRIVNVEYEDDEWMWTYSAAVRDLNVSQVIGFILQCDGPVHDAVVRQMGDTSINVLVTRASVEAIMTSLNSSLGNVDNESLVQYHIIR